MDDANFSRETADSAIVSLANEENWIRDTLALDSLRSGDADLSFMDKVLVNETNRLVRATEECYAKMQFREGIQRGWFEMVSARGEYRSWCKDSGVPMNRDIVRKWAESLVVLICPVCPHWAEKMWKDILGKDGLAVKAPWPQAAEEDKILTREAMFLRHSLKHFRSMAGKAKKNCTTATILISDAYPEWKVGVLTWMQGQYDADSGTFPADFMKQLKTWATTGITDKKLMKFSMQFASWMKKEVEDCGPSAMDLQLPFDQKSIMMGSEEYIKSQLNLPECGIINLDDDGDDKPKIPDKICQQVMPGKPYLWMH